MVGASPTLDVRPRPRVGYGVCVSIGGVPTIVTPAHTGDATTVGLITHGDAAYVLTLIRAEGVPSAGLKTFTIHSCHPVVAVSSHAGQYLVVSAGASEVTVATLVTPLALSDAVHPLCAPPVHPVITATTAGSLILGTDGVPIGVALPLSSATPLPALPGGQVMVKACGSTAAVVPLARTCPEDAAPWRLLTLGALQQLLFLPAPQAQVSPLVPTPQVSPVQVAGSDKPAVEVPVVSIVPAPVVTPALPLWPFAMLCAAAVAVVAIPGCRDRLASLLTRPNP